MKYEELRNDIKNGFVCENPVYELIRRTSPDFDDSPDTIVIIDEIQESAAIYNRIREFTRRLKSDFIITGSYLRLTSYFLPVLRWRRQRLQQWAIVYAKGNTHGGVKDQVFTIPVYGIGKFEF